MATNIIDAKLNRQSGITITREGNRRLDLEELFQGELTTHDDTVDDLPAVTVVRSTMSRLQLAGNARLYTSRFDGRTNYLHDFYSFGGWDSENYGRTIHQGPMEPGPYMFAFKLGTMLTATPQLDETAFLVEAGDLLVFQGTEFVVEFTGGRDGYIRLTPVAAMAV